jgi:hypothetical protein
LNRVALEPKKGKFFFFASLMFLQKLQGDGTKEECPLSRSGPSLVPLVADHHQFAGLVGGDRQRGAEPPQQRGEGWRMGST